MASSLKELARIRFTGDRSVEHALEVSALQAVIQFETLLNEVASFVRHGRSGSTLKSSTQIRRIEIYLRSLESGSTVVPLEVNAEVMEWAEVHEGLQLMSSVFTNPSECEQEIPHSLALKFRKLAQVLTPNESMLITGAWNTSFPITRAVSKQIKGYNPLGGTEFALTQMTRIPERSEPGRIEAILRSLAAKVPKEEWEKLPPDLTDDLDHYLYGTPKK